MPPRSLIFFFVALFFLPPFAAETKTLAPSPLGSKINVAELYKAIMANKTKKLAVALNGLPDELKDYYAFKTDSESPQTATPAHPRTLLSNADGTFYAAFNGDPTEGGYNELEFFQYLNGEAELYYIDFDPNGLADPVLSMPNPSEPLVPHDRACINCHGIYGLDRPGPLWNAYIGARGKDEDYDDSYRGYRADWIPSRNPTEPSSYISEELKKAMDMETQLKSFLSAAISDPRYSILHNLVSGFMPAYTHIHYSPALHNSVFTYRIQRLSADRAARILAQRSDYEKIKYEILKASARCDPAFTLRNLNYKIELMTLVSEDDPPPEKTPNHDRFLDNPFASPFFDSEILAAFMVYYDPALQREFPLRWKKPGEDPQAYLRHAHFDGDCAPALSSLPEIPVLPDDFCRKLAELKPL